jgi:hypothetical protein
MKFSLILISSFFALNIQAEVCNPPVANNNKDLNFLSRSVDLVTCKIDVKKNERYSKEGCAKYSSCQTSNNTNLDAKLYAEVAEKHGKALLENSFKNFSGFCNNKLKLEASQTCNLDIMKKVVKVESLNEKIKNNDAEAERYLKGLKSYLRTAKVGTVTKESVAENYKKNGMLLAGQIVNDPFAGIAQDQDYLKLMEIIVKFEPGEERNESLDRMFKSYRMNLDEKNCDLGVPSVQTICVEVTRINNGEVRPTSMNNTELNQLYSSESEDRLDLSFARCTVFDVLEKSEIKSSEITDSKIQLFEGQRKPAGSSKIKEF